jgi:hypothetical protein
MEAPPKNTSLAVKYGDILEKFKHITYKFPVCGAYAWGEACGSKVAGELVKYKFVLKHYQIAGMTFFFYPLPQQKYHYLTL